MEAVIFCGYSLPHLSTKPAGAYLIAQVFRSMGIETQVIDFIFAYTPEERELIFKKYLNDDTKFVCLSTTLAGPAGNKFVYLNEMDDFFRPIFNEAKIAAPNAKFIVGGPKVLRENSSLPFDYSVRGQGESAIVSLVNHLRTGSELKVSEVDGPTTIITDKDYPIGDFNSQPALKFHERDLIEWNETLPIEVSRGCVFKCSYCDFYLTGKKFGDFSKHEDMIYETMMHNYEKFGVTRYIITDDTLNDSPLKAEMMLRISKRLPFKLEYGGSMRIELFDKHPQMAQMFLESGLKTVSFGIETFNKKSGATVGKGFGQRAKDVLLFLESVWQNNVSISINLILGLPFETKEMIQESFDWASNTTAVDSLFCNPFFIWRVKDASSILRNPELFGYYKDTKKGTNPRYIEWESKDHNFLEMVELATFYRQEFARRKNHILGHSANSFITMVILQYYSLEEQRKIPYHLTDKIFGEVYKKRFAAYKERLLNS